MTSNGPSTTDSLSLACLTIQALRTRDPAALRQAQVNIAARRAGIRTPIGATPGAFETPGASLLRAPHGATAEPPTPAMTPLMGRYGGAIPGRGDGRDSNAGPPDSAQQLPALAPPMTLDRFLSKHTSEDNASFAELLQDMNDRRKQAQPWLHAAHQQVLLMKLPATSMMLGDVTLKGAALAARRPPAGAAGEAASDRHDVRVVTLNSHNRRQTNHSLMTPSEAIVIRGQRTSQTVAG